MLEINDFNAIRINKPPYEVGEVLSEDEKPVELTDDVDGDMAALDGINLSGMERGEF